MSAPAAIATTTVTAGDRLLAMVFLAGLFHLVVILGVSFTAPAAAPPRTPTLEVLLVSEALPEASAARDAAYLAQRNQQGSGTPEQLTRLPRPGDRADDQPGPADGAPAAAPPESPAGGAPQVLAGAVGAAPRPADAATAAAPPAPAPRQSLAGAATLLSLGDDDADLRLQGAERRELLVTPATRAAGAAVYLDAWKRRVEQVGTLHFPHAARRRRLSGNPVVEVVLDPGGRLLAATVRRSSGHPELDQAALEILRLATPFEAFAPELAAQYDQLRFAYEWQFVGGRLSGSAVGLPADGR